MLSVSLSIERKTNQVMKDMKPIAMKCSDEQFETILPILEENEVVIKDVGSFKHFPYLTNCLDNVLGRVSNILGEHGGRYGRKVFEEWDQDTFLQYCGIETKPKFIPTAMKCTMEQFQSIHPILLDHGKTVHQITNDFHLDRCYLVNNHDQGITNMRKESSFVSEAKVVYETWDGDLFLKNCGIEVKQNKENMNKVYTRSIEDMMKIHNVACDTWKTIILKEYIQKVNPYDGLIEVTEKQIDAMFNAATLNQIPVLEGVFGRQKKRIEWDKIGTGSKVMIQNTGQHCSGVEDIDLSLPVDVVFWKTPHLITGGGEFSTTGGYSSYCTFHQNGKYVLFASHEDTDYVTEVVKY